MATGAGVKRAVRVADQVREEVAGAIVRDLGDPRLANAIITRVEMPDDLSFGRIFVRLTTGGEDEAARKRLMKGLEAATGQLRKRVGQRLHLRRTPELKFVYDTGIDASDRVSDLLAEIARENRERK